jgi:enoyl-CoA hydratase
MSYQHILVEKQAARLEVTINRPQALNALNRGVIEELTTAVESVMEEPEVRTVLITGAGDKAFVAGADIADMVGLDAEGAMAFAAHGHALGDAIAHSDKIVFAVVNGFALGGGCELALACDIIYASDRAKFGQPEVKLGVIPGFGGTQRLARRVGLHRAMELVTVGEPISAEEALRMGLVNAVLPAAELLAHARKMADKIAERGAHAIASAKRAVRQSQELPLEEGNRYEMGVFAHCFITEDQKEGMKAFLEKRPPKFQGR